MESNKINRLMTECVLNARGAFCLSPRCSLDFRVYLESKLFDGLVFSVKSPTYPTLDPMDCLTCELKATFDGEPVYIQVRISRDACANSITHHIEMMVAEFVRHFVTRIGLGL